MLRWLVLSKSDCLSDLNDERGDIPKRWGGPIAVPFRAVFPERPRCFSVRCSRNGTALVPLRLLSARLKFRIAIAFPRARSDAKAVVRRVRRPADCRLRESREQR